jgi:crotonobetainyl-CoA:carnitine CoA-transferase CaiB-like acyl-CoA transferase
MIKTSEKSLRGIRVIDCSRVLAGPFCTQILGDLGAEIIKIEKPGAGDDTRAWGPPFLKDANGQDSSESAYYLSANRNKKSLAVDISKPEGQAIIHELLKNADILIENFKTGGLAKYGLGYDAIHARHPHIIYTSITGFGQNGPLAPEPGYDFLAQAMAGLMSATGAPNGDPTKVGVAVSDIMTGLYAAIGTLAALNARKETGKGQHVDVALLDCTLSAMTNVAQYYLTSGALAPRLGNAHSTIVPYQVFEAQDGHLIVAIGNDAQFARFCDHIGKPEWITDSRFAKNSARVANRDILVPIMADIIASRTVESWISSLYDIDVPCGPVNTMDQTFAMEQIQARSMKISMDHPLSDTPVHLVGSPLKLSETPVSYDLPPPPCGMHTDDILRNLLNKTEPEIQALRDKNIIS